MNGIWKTPGMALGVTRIISLHDAFMNLRFSVLSQDKPEAHEASENLIWLYNVISSFIEEKHKNIEGDSCEDQDPVEFLDVCATTTQLHGMRVGRIVRLLKKADDSLATYKRFHTTGSGSYLAVPDLFDSQWDILIPRLRERVERIAWQIHIGEHTKWKPGGEEWRNIEKFYGGLRQRVTMTRLNVPALLVPAPCLRKIYVTTRPVDASERNPWPHRRMETEEGNSGTAGIIQAATRYVPVSCQHWALVVEKGNTSAIWELGVVEGRIKIDKNLQYYPEPSHRMLIGYTTMSNNEISASAEVARRCMGDMYSFSTFNCQLFCNILFQFIRVSHTMSDAFSDLRALPDDSVVPTVKRRLKQLGTIICVDPSEVEKLQPMPIFFGTLYTRALIVTTTSLLVHIFINLGVDFFFLVTGVVVAWSPFAQRHTNLYPWSAKRDPDQRRLRHLYYADNTWKESASGQFVTQSAGSQRELFRQSGRIVEIDDWEGIERWTRRRQIE